MNHLPSLAPKSSLHTSRAWDTYWETGAYKDKVWVLCTGPFETLLLYPNPISGSHTSAPHVAVTSSVCPSSLDSSCFFIAILFLWLAYLLPLRPFLGPAQIIAPLLRPLRSSGFLLNLALSCLLLRYCSYLVCPYQIVKCLKAGDIICWMNKWLVRAKGWRPWMWSWMQPSQIIECFETNNIISAIFNKASGTGWMEFKGGMRFLEAERQI